MRLKYLPSFLCLIRGKTNERKCQSMALPEEFLERLRARTDIEDVISPYVNLKRRGRMLVGLCPFHGEKTPSFTVYKDTQSFFCFGCETGGDAITFIKNIENLSYLEAVKFLASKAGIPLPEDGYDDRAAMERKSILDANREAARFFYASLQAPSGARAKQYIMSRGLREETITKYGLGFAPDSWDSLYKHLKSKGFSDIILFKAALINKSSKGNFFDQFRNRLMFPIIDLRGNVVAFGGRDLGDRGPKYLNSSETPVYKKSQILFALNVAKNTKKDYIILTEGYMDTISVHQAGFTEAVATCGTALTEEQANIISRYAKEVILAYDSDEAGQKATARATPILKKAGLEVRVLKLTGAKDPDEFIKKFGAIRFKNLLEGSDTAADYEFSKLKEKYDIMTDSGKIAYLHDAVEFIAKIPSSMEREVYASKIANETGVNKSTVLLSVDKQKKKNIRSAEKAEWNREKSPYRFMRDKVTPEKATNLSAAVCEEKLISIMLKNPEYVDKIIKSVSAENFVVEFHKKLFGIISDLSEKGAEISLTLISQYLDGPEIGKLSGYLANESDFNYTFEDAQKFISALKKDRNIDKVREMSEEEYKEYMQKLINSKNSKG